MLRLTIAGAAIAQQMGEAQDAKGNAPVEMAQAATDPDVLLDALQKRADQLDVRERRIAERLAILEIAEAEFEERRKSMIEAEQKLAATLAIADNAAENDIQQLTAVYESMKPKKAAEIFDSMDGSFAAGFLIRMAPQAAADILTAMSTEGAYAVSVIMAARNVGAPTE